MTVLLALGLGCGVGSDRAAAHDLFMAYVQHEVQLRVGARHTDVTIHLTFFEDGSEHEREHLDSDGDGRIRRAEIEAYLRALEPSLSGQVHLVVGGRTIPLLPLYRPALDLLGDEGVGRSHHRLSVFLFARTPDFLGPGVEVVVEERLWPGLRALGSFRVTGADGCRLEHGSRGEPLIAPLREGETRRFAARCVEPPGVGREVWETVLGDAR